MQLLLPRPRGARAGDRGRATGSGGAARAGCSIALRENPRAAESYGVNALRTMLAGVRVLRVPRGRWPACCFVHHQHVVSQDIIDNPFSRRGEPPRVRHRRHRRDGARCPGAILGAVYVFGMQYYMLPEYRFLATGIGLLAILLILPGGLGAGLAEARDGRAALGRQAPRHPRAEPGGRPARRRVPRDPGDGRGRRRGRRAAGDRRARGGGRRMTRHRPPPTATPSCSASGATRCTRPARRAATFDDITGGHAALPADHPVRPQRRRRARPHASSACSDRRSATTSGSTTRATSP